MPKTISRLPRILFTGLGLRTVLSFVPPCGVAWVFFILYLDALRQHDPSAFWTALILGLAGIALGSAIVVWLILSVVPPLRRTIELTVALEKGDLDIDIPYRRRRDELGELARALEGFRQNALEKRLWVEREAALEQQAAAERRRAARQTADAFLSTFDGSIGGLLSVQGTQELSVRTLRDAVGVATEAVGSASHAAREAYESISAIAAASEELAASSHEIGRQASHSRTVAEEAAQGVERTNVQAVTLKEAARGIDSVVKLINSIAGQTNLLALNATIEAARAGEVGKGFAVVAGEVKSLANQTASATKEIGEHIESIQAAIADVVKNVSDVVTTIERSREISTSIADAVAQQIAATVEISRNAQTAVGSTAHVDADIASLSEMVGKVEAAARDADEAGRRSQQECAALQHEVNRFVEHAA